MEKGRGEGKSVATAPAHVSCASVVIVTRASEAAAAVEVGRCGDHG